MSRLLASVAALVALALAGAASSAQGASLWIKPQVLAAPVAPISALEVVSVADSAAIVYGAGATANSERVFASVLPARSQGTDAAPAGFEAPVALSDVGRVIHVSAIIDNAGRVTVAWSQANASGGDASVYVRTKPARGAWGASQTITAHQPLASEGYPELVGGTYPMELDSQNARTALLVEDGVYQRAPHDAAFSAISGSGDAVHIAMSADNQLATLALVPTAAGRAAVEVRTDQRESSSTAVKQLGTAVIDGASDPSALAMLGSGAIVAAWRSPTGLLAATRTDPTGGAVWSDPLTIDGGADAPGPELRVRYPGEAVLAFGDRQVVLPGPNTATPRELAPTAAGRGFPGRELVVSANSATGGALQVSERSQRSETFGAPETVLAPGGGVQAYRSRWAVVDDFGDSFVPWLRTMDDGSTQLGVSANDRHPPMVNQIIASERATVGVPFTATADVSDRFGVPQVAWTGDGKAAIGASFTTTFTAPGTYTIAATPTDSVGNVGKTVSQRVVVTAAAPSAGFLAPQSLIDPMAKANPFDIAAGRGGGAVLSFRGSTTFPEGGAGDRLWVAVREQGAPPTSSAPRGFRSGEPITPLGSRALAAPVGMDASGNATVAYWIDDDAFGTPGTVYTRYRPAGGAWSEAQRISEQSFLSTTNVGPELRVASSGRAVLLTDAGLFERAPGATTFTAVPDTADVRHVAMNEAGHIAAEFITPGPDASTGNLSVRLKTAGGAWQAPQSLGLIYTRDPYFLRERSPIVLTANGTVVVAWDEGATDGQGGKPGHGVNVAVRAPGSSFGTGTWTTAEEVNAAAPQPPEGWNLTATVDNARQASISWLQGTYADGSGWSLQGLFPGGGPATRVTAGGSFAVSQAGGGRALRLPAVCAGDITARVRPKAGDAFGDLKTVIRATRTESYCSQNARVALDDEGNGYIAWSRHYALRASPLSGMQLVGITGYDPVAPKITSVAATPAVVGAPVALVAAATDRMSVPRYTWSFGDGTSQASGGAVMHTYARAGTYQAKVTAKDEAGNTSSWNKTVVVTN